MKTYGVSYIIRNESETKVIVFKGGVIECVLLVDPSWTYPRSTARAKSPPGGGPFYFELTPTGIDWNCDSHFPASAALW